MFLRHNLYIVKSGGKRKMKYKEGDTVYLKRDKAVISQLYKSSIGEEGYIVVKNDDNDHLYFVKEDGVELIESECISSVGKTSEPTDNAKIEELDMDSTTWNDLYIEQKLEVLFNKQNEVIRYINKEE